jgi:UDP-N-acetylmuramate: L-alanyl-gamma-D-glutamyl-meso-diaminopimelate ligase
VSNALGAIAAAHHVGVEPSLAIEALASFQNVKRRMEVLAEINHITLYDDFAHHPTAIASTLAGLRGKVSEQRIIAVLELRSNTMKMGVHKDALLPSLVSADSSFIYLPDELNWRMDLENYPAIRLFKTMQALIEAIVLVATPGDHIVFMSNGGFGGIHQSVETLLAD